MNGYELSNHMNNGLGSDFKVNNREVKVLTNLFGSKISFYQPKQVNKSEMLLVVV